MKQSEVVATVAQKPTFTHEQLLNALYFIKDLFSRPNIPFFLLGDTAYSAKHDKSLSGDGITVGIRALDYQYRTLSILEAFYLADKVTDDEINYTFNDVPVTVKIIKDNDPMFTSINTFMYQHDSFAVPNPFERYWAQRESYV